MDEFERMLNSFKPGLERFVRFRLPSQTDAEDVLQDICLTAYQKFPQLKKQGCLQTLDHQHCPK